MEFTLLWASLLGAGAMWVTDRVLNREQRHFDDLLAATLMGLVVGRLAAMVVGGSYPWSQPGLILLVRAGVHPGWASLGALGLLAWRFRSTSLPISLAPMAVPALAGLSGWEMGCVFRSACGGVTAGSWEVPIGGLAGLGFGLAALIVYRIPLRTKAAAALAAAGLVRTAADPFRSALNHSVIWWYLAAVLAGVALAIIWRSQPVRTGAE
jgi:hypothetical protein